MTYLRCTRLVHIFEFKNQFPFEYLVAFNFRYFLLLNCQQETIRVAKSVPTDERSSVKHQSYLSCHNGFSSCIDDLSAY